LTHDLDELLTLLADSGAVVPGNITLISGLTVFAVQFRYEIFDQSTGSFDRTAILDQVEALVSHVSQVLKGT
jgi:hypothetical protein